MPLFCPIALLPLLVLPAGAHRLNDAQLLVEAQLQAAAAAVAVLERKELPPATRAESLLPLANELARLHARRSQVDAALLAEAEAAAANNREVQALALRLLRAMELCAASGYENSPQLQAALLRLSLAIEGELDEAPPSKEDTSLTGQNGAAQAH